MKKARTHPISQFISTIPLSIWIMGGVFIILASALGYASWYGLGRIHMLEAQNRTLEGRIASTTLFLQESITEVERLLGSELEEERGRLASIQNRLSAFQSEVGTISGSVSTLEKLSKTDEELLQKYSRVFFLNEHYAPNDVVEIPNELKYNEKRIYAIHTQVYPYLENMIKAAKALGVELYVFSAYRSFDEQSALKGQYTVIYGEGSANQFSADQGYSEHQLGTTVDLITTGIGGTLSGFENTTAYQWLLDNAERFGFTISYPENNQYYVFEPWHWRFVGVKLATHLRTTGVHFYDLSQREIDEYLVTIFD